MKRATIFILSIAIISLLVASPAAAGTRTLRLEPVSMDQEAWGLASLTSSRKVDTFTVRADADFASLVTMVVISVNLFDGSVAGRWVDVARAEMRLGTSLTVLSSDKDISPVFPVADIRGVRVSHRGRVILESSLSNIP